MYIAEGAKKATGLMKTGLNLMQMVGFFCSVIVDFLD